VDLPGSLEVPLIWTGNKAELRTANVSVHVLEPARPVLGGDALVIDGDHIGKVVTVLKRKRGGRKQVSVRCEWADHLTDMSEADLCRVADED
jgi:hypothetical protein